MASIATAVAVNPGLLRNRRIPNRTSRTFLNETDAPRVSAFFFALLQVGNRANRFSSHC